MYRIAKICNSEGHWADNQTEIRRTVEDHFLKLFYTGRQCEWGDILDCVSTIVMPEMNEILNKNIEEEEIKDAVFQMGTLKAPGSDGFQGVFYHSFWDIISWEVNGMAANFMNGRTSPRRLNSTSIVLIPKTQNPELVSHFRPISLCNFSYKVL